MSGRVVSSTVDPVGAAIDEQKSARPRVRSIIAVVVVGIGLLVSLALLLQGLTFLNTWSSGYGGRGEFIVESCAIESPRFSGHVVCGGQLVPDDNPRPLTSELRGPEAAFGSERPTAGEVVPVYFRPDDTTSSFPSEGRMVELARAIAGVVPLVFLVFGAGAWLIGWFLTRETSRTDAEERLYLQSFPSRFALRPRGAAWALFGAAWWLVDRWLVNDLLGTVGFG